MDLGTLFKLRRRDIIPILLVTLTAVGIFILGPLFGGLLVTIALLAVGKTSDQISDTFSSTGYVANMIGFIVIAAVVIGMVYLVLKRLRVKNPLVFMKLRKLPTLFELFEVLTTYGLFFLTIIVVRIVLAVFNVIDVQQAQDLNIAQPETFAAYAAVFVTIAILPPLWEEILFRGYFYTKLKQFTSIGVAGVIVSTLFGLAHIEGSNLNWIAVVDTAVFSGFLIYIYEKHGKLLSAMLLHAVKNAIAFLTLFVAV